MSEKRKVENLLGIKSFDADDTLLTLKDFPELSKVVSVDGKVLETEPDTDIDDYPFGALQRKLKKLDDNELIRYLAGLEMAAEISSVLILDNAGLEGTNRIKKTLEQKEIKVMEPEMIPLFMMSQLIDVGEEELQKRNLLKDFRNSVPHYHYVQNKAVVYESYHDRMIDVLAMYAARYVDDYALLDIVDGLSSSLHEGLGEIEDSKEEKDITGEIKTKE